MVIPGAPSMKNHLNAYIPVQADRRATGRRLGLRKPPLNQSIGWSCARIFKFLCRWDNSAGDLYRPEAQQLFHCSWHGAGIPRNYKYRIERLPINEVGQVGYFVTRGYCHLTVNARGTGKITRKRLLPFHESEPKDVADTIEWARHSHG